MKITNGLYKFLLQKRTLIFSIIILSFLLRIYALSFNSLWYDETYSIDMAKNNVSTIIYKTVSTDVHPPLYYIILHFWMNFFGDSEFSARFISLIFGVFSIYLIYKLGKLIFNEEIGIISAFILSISLFHIHFSQEVRFYSILPFLVLLSNYYFVKLIETFKNTKIKNTEKEISKDSKVNSIMYIVSTMIMVYTHYFGIFYIIFQNIYYLTIYRKNIRLWSFIQAIILILFLPLANVLLHQTREQYTSITFLAPFYTIESFAGNYTVLLLFIILGCVGIISQKYYKSDYKYMNDKIFLVLWLFLPILVTFIISYFHRPIYSSKYFIGSLPALLLLVSKGFYDLTIYISNIIRIRYVKVMTTLVLISLLILPSIYSLEQYYYTPSNEQWRDVANYLEKNKGNNDIILIYRYGVITPFKYYYKKDSNYKGIRGTLYSYKKTKIEGEIKNSTKGYDVVWLILSHDNWNRNIKNESKLIQKTLENSYDIRYSINYIGIKLSYFTLKRNGNKKKLNKEKNGNYTL